MLYPMGASLDGATGLLGVNQLHYECYRVAAPALFTCGIAKGHRSKPLTNPDLLSRNTMKKPPSREENVPVTVRVPTSTLKSIDDWRRTQRVIPTRTQFLRQAVIEKLRREDQAR